jgi:DNA-binding Lrp family transcriptional regulator
MPVFQKAFVLVKTDPGKERSVLDSLMKITEVTEVHVVPGEWDLLVMIQAPKEIVVPSDELVYEVVIDKISKIKSVQDTLTMVSHFSKTK